MVFSELMELIQHESNVDIKILSQRIGISVQTFNNILFRKVLNPDAKTVEKILNYCLRYNIDTNELDWNEILFEIFSNSIFHKEYKWEEDVIEDDDGNRFVKLKHLSCGRSTLVPDYAFNGKSPLCIHCWIENNISLEQYTYNEYETKSDYTFTHFPCGNKYTLTYKQIKQKKHRCPQCFSNSICEDSHTETEKSEYMRTKHFDITEDWAKPELLNDYVRYATEKRKISWANYNNLFAIAPEIAVIIFATSATANIDKDKINKYNSFFALFDFDSYNNYLEEFSISSSKVKDEEKKKKRYLVYLTLEMKNGNIHNLLIMINELKPSDEGLRIRAYVLSSSEDVQDKLTQEALDNVNYFKNISKSLTTMKNVCENILQVESFYEMFVFFRTVIENGKEGANGVPPVLNTDITSLEKTLTLLKIKRFGFILGLNKKDEVSVTELNLPATLYNMLKRCKFQTVQNILDNITDIGKLKAFRIGHKARVALLIALDEKGYRIGDCSKEQYPDIYDYIRLHFSCRDCGSKLDGSIENIQNVLCSSCAARRERLKQPRKINIEIKQPEYTTYTGGEKGFTLYFNIMPKMSNPIKLKLQECSVFVNGRQHSSNYNYVGYAFDEEYIIPATIKTFAKIWITDKWEKKQIEENNYLTLSFQDKTNNKLYYFKFRLDFDNEWSLYDYYELD